MTNFPTLITPDNYIFDDTDILDDIGTTETSYSVYTPTIMYTSPFVVDDNILKISTLAYTGKGASLGVAYGEYQIIITDGVNTLNSGLFGDSSRIVNWYIDLSNFNHTDMKITILGNRSKLDYRYQNGVRGGGCRGDCNTGRELKLYKISISSNMNDPPIPDFTITPSTIIEKEGVVFDASTSYSNWNTNLSFSWRFGDGEISNDKIITHTYINPGTYLLSLIVSDNLNPPVEITDIITVNKYGDIITEPPIIIPPCIPDWQCSQPLDGTMSDGCGNTQSNPECDMISEPPVSVSTDRNESYVKPVLYGIIGLAILSAIVSKED